MRRLYRALPHVARDVAQSAAVVAERTEASPPQHPVAAAAARAAVTAVRHFHGPNPPLPDLAGRSPDAGHGYPVGYTTPKTS
jgi:hypothetical protein